MMSASNPSASTPVTPARPMAAAARDVIARAALTAPQAGLVVQRWCRVRADENDDDPRGPGVAVGLGPEDLDPA